MSSEAQAAIAEAVAKHSESPSGDRPSGGAPAPTKDTPVSTQTPADASRLGAQPSPSSSTAPPASQGTDEDEAPKDPTKVAAWLTPEKHARVVENTRKRTEAQARAEVEGLLGVKLDDWEMVEHIRQFSADPRRYLQEAIPHLIRQGRLTLPQPDPAAPQPRTTPTNNGNGFQKPQPRLTAEDGTPAYDAAAVDQHIENITQHFENQLAALREQMSPLSEMHTRMQHQQVLSQADNYAKTVLAEMATMDGFEELKPKIKALMERDGRVTIHSAYARLYNSDYLPTKEQKIRQQTLDDVNKRPLPPKQVSTSAAPRATSTGRTGPRTAREAIEIAVNKLS